MYMLSAMLHSLCIAAHMEMVEPPPIRSQYNQFYDYTEVDFDYNSPLRQGQFPCKGYHHGEHISPVRSYVAGDSYLMSIAGTATHFGGSCQISLSYDGGQTFQVIKSMIGACPLQYNYEFTVPEHAPDGVALLSWSWISNTGNRDFYQNCAWVDILSNNTESVEMDGPEMFVAQLPGTCVVPEGFDFMYPDPGDNIEYGGDPAYFTTRCEFIYHVA